MANFYGYAKAVYGFSQRPINLVIALACSIPLTSTMAMAEPSMSQWGMSSNVRRMNRISYPGVNVASQREAAKQERHEAKSWNVSRRDVLNANVIQNVASQARAERSFKTLMNRNGVAVRDTTRTLRDGVNINLRSGQLNFLAGNLANFTNLTIDVGGRKETVSLNTRLTAAEAIAVQQILTDGIQTIVIGSNGSATGGSVTLTSDMISSLNSASGSSSLKSLTVASGVQLIHNVTSLDLSGRFTNHGTVLTAADTINSTDTISANRIHNARGGTIDSYSGGDLFAADLILNATHSVTNFGSIGNANNLTINAPVIFNAAERTGPAPSIVAGGNLNLNTNNLINTGLIASTMGNIAVASTNALSFTGTDGAMYANKGNINFKSNNLDLDVVGGDFFSKQLNLDAGTGKTNSSVGHVTGMVSTSGCNSHFYADTDLLVLGDNLITGDPTYVNTGGSIALVGTMTAGADTALSIIASQNITAVGNTQITAPGADVTLVAGATISPNSTAQFPLAAGGKVSVSFTASSTGGNVDLMTGNTSASPVINTVATAANGDGGHVSVIAFAKGGTGGSVSVGSISTNGLGTGDNGSVTIIAGGTNSPAINATNISTSSGIVGVGSGDLGNVTLTNANPIGTVVFSSTGIAKKAFKSAPLTANGGGITTDSVTTGGGDFTAAADGLITVGASGGTLSTDGLAPGQDGGTVTINGSSITIGPAGAISSNGAGGSTGMAGVPGKSGKSGGDAGNGGDIILTATGAFTAPTGTAVRANGGAGGGGGLGGAAVVAGKSGGAGGSGGDAGVGGSITINAASMDITGQIQAQG
nr:hypothetical protein [Candidatus Melainabacteria bacterium]